MDKWVVLHQFLSISLNWHKCQFWEFVNKYFHISLCMAKNFSQICSVVREWKIDKVKALNPKLSMEVLVWLIDTCQTTCQDTQAQYSFNRRYETELHKKQQTKLIILSATVSTSWLGNWSVAFSLLWREYCLCLSDNFIFMLSKVFFIHWSYTLASKHLMLQTTQTNLVVLLLCSTNAGFLHPAMDIYIQCNGNAPVVVHNSIDSE